MLRKAWALMDPARIDATRDAYLSQALSTVQTWRSASEAEAVDYLARYRLAEIGTSSGALVIPGVDVAATIGLLDGYGPRGLKHRISQGVAPSSAYSQQLSLFLARAQSVILSGGRGVVRESAQADGSAVGYRRVANRGACTFCAMLASRGPRYSDEARALTAGLPEWVRRPYPGNPYGKTSRSRSVVPGRGWVGANGNPDPYHDGCRCTVEVVYGEWQPEPFEMEWYEAYHDAVNKLKAERGEWITSGGKSKRQRRPYNSRDVLAQMRKDGNFRDSPARRAAAAAAGH